MKYVQAINNTKNDSIQARLNLLYFQFSTIFILIFYWYKKINIIMENFKHDWLDGHVVHS